MWLITLPSEQQWNNIFLQCDLNTFKSSAHLHLKYVQMQLKITLWYSLYFYNLFKKRYGLFSGCSFYGYDVLKIFFIAKFKKVPDELQWTYNLHLLGFTHAFLFLVITVFQTHQVLMWTRCHNISMKKIM